MVRHVVVGIVRDYEIRLRILYYLHNLVAALGVVGIDVKIVEHAIKDFNACQLPRFTRLLRAHRDEFLRLDHYMPQRPVAKMRDDHPVATLHAFRQGTGTRDLNIVGMASYGQYIHRTTSF